MPADVQQLPEKTQLQRHGMPLAGALYLLVALLTLPLLGLILHITWTNARNEARLNTSAALNLARVSAASAERFLNSVRQQAVELGQRPAIRALDPEHCDPLLQTPRALNPSYTYVIVYNRAGVPVCPPPPPGAPGFSNYQATPAPEFTALISTGRPWMRKPYVGPVSRKWIVAYISPLRDKQGDIIGAIDVSLELAAFDLGTDKQLTGDSVVQIIDQDGITVARSRSPQFAVGSSARGTFHAIADADRGAPLDIVDIALTEHYGEAGGIDSSGVPTMFGYVPVAGTRWIALAAVPNQNVVAASLRRSLLYTLPVLLAAMLAAFWVSRAIVHPIRALIQASGQIAGGNLDAQALTRGASETREMAMRFNQMVDALRTARRGLLDSEKKFQLLCELSADWYWEQDADFRFIEVTVSPNSRLGIQLSPYLGHRRWEMPGADLGEERWVQHVAAHHRHEPYFDFRYTAPARDGLPALHLSISGVPKFDQSGAFAGYRGTGRDIGELALTAAERDGIRLRHDALAAITNGAVWERDAELRLTEVLGGRHARLRRYIETMRGKTPWEGHAQIPPQQLEEYQRAAAAHEMILDGEYPVTDDLGESRWIRMSCAPLVGPDGRFEGYYGISHDVTASRHSKRLLRLFSKAAEQSSDLILLTDADLEPPGPRIVYANPAFCKQSGYGLDELAGKSPRLLQGPGTDRAVLDDMRAKLRAGQSAMGEALNYSKYGKPYWVQWRVDPVRDQDGVITHYLALERDVTERRRESDGLTQTNLELEARVLERTRTLEESLKSLDEFAYSVSHDLRGPLRSIEGFASVIAEEIGEESIDDKKLALERIRAAVARMGAMIDGILTFSRASRAEPARAPVDMSALAREIADQIAANEPQRAARWNIAENVVATGDPVLLRGVLQNLLGNAWKYSSKVPMPEIEFGTLTTENGDTAYFVRDNGAGFNLRYASKLFSPFQRLHSDQEFPGTGVGLAITARVIARHQGRIWAQSTVGTGSTFLFTLPTPKPGVREAQAAAQAQ